MAITASGLFIPTDRDVYDTTQLAIDLDLETHKGALFSDTVAPNFSTDTAYGVAPYNANEVTGTGWASGGVALIGTTYTESPTGTMMFDATDVDEDPTTLADAMGYLLYADALAGNNAIGYLLYADALAGDNAICLVDFVTAVSTTAGRLLIQWAATGIFTKDLTP